jgi:3-oxoadipate enol-lactonase
MDFEDGLRTLGAQTLLVAAEHDHGGGPVDAMRAMAAVLPNARLEVIANSGHIVNHEAPEQLAALLHRHLIT